MERPERQAENIVLVYVEDEADAREMVCRMLGMNYPGVTIIPAENGAAGLAVFREHAPQVVMTDINMPVMDGIRMSREIKALNPETVIVAVTAHSDTSYLMSAIEIGIDRYVLKPINYDELFAVLDAIFEDLALKRLVREQTRRLEASERQLSEAQKIAHLGSWQWELGDGTMSWSDELYRILGLVPGSVAPSMEGALELVHPEDRGAVQARTEEIRRGLIPDRPLFFRILRPDGVQRIIRGQAELIRDGAGNGVSIIGSAHDVTEIKEAEEKIRSLTCELEQRVIQRTSQLEATVRELESFSHVVSHDLRAPLARLEGFCRALVEDCSGCPNRNCSEYAERAERVVRQVKRIIDAFNSLSHYARCHLSVADVDLAAIAREVAQRLGENEPGRRVEFVLPQRLMVRGDGRLLQTLLEILLGNAWKFSAKKDAARIEFGVIPREGELVYFVRDNGAGFDMKYVGKLFKPFQTVHSPGEYAWDGTSIGLATVHSVVLRHGGKVWAEGVVGEGATFYFTLVENPEPQ
ncbi:sensor histidine kinase [Geomesophilobacter sediminis]|uniref:histidine kinase n=1 Tax=Geomesophilobacter sediminis TaxID=2798584 RepID=A0A8J7IN57_9BACT|nr:response regulator [Geomesophilobacter sediminis]MBJ6723394.1 response regulator [Geomesophilobacter sediminis]